MFAGTSWVTGPAESRTVVPDRMSSVTVVVITRADGLVAYTWVRMVMGPPCAAGSRSQDTVIPTCACRAFGPVPHVLGMFSETGVASFVMFQMCFEPCVAVMSLLRLCGRISFTGIETVFLLPPRSGAEPRYDCSDEPG